MERMVARRRGVPGSGVAMSRRMSCSLTIDAVRDRSKTVTRRHVDTWRDLKAGDRLTLIEKGMGLPRGSRQVVICEVEVVAVEIQPLYWMSPAECVREGFPHMSPGDFIELWRRTHGYGRRMSQLTFEAIQCRRIEWAYPQLSGASFMFRPMRQEWPDEV